ncbi:PAQR family membrane homeostasis protein TrhA [Clostridium massiliamazoniense]|uniref:PAQR family membrane homeostasis protein TrhA n=1 Tax=Clostridium massiliamazoniense TaxID=1347366 RepID=UPI0006D7F3CD|nr:hemolysin III family protein [Clostridium massiliamazoniense]
MNKIFREPINGLSHLFGAILSLAALITMIIKVSLFGSNLTLEFISVCTFGISLILLYSASATYHLAIASEKILLFLRKLDHSMIFLLIGGTYIPFCLLALDGALRIVLTSIIVLLTIAGIIFKLFWFKCPRWLSTSLYIGMGWIAIFIIYPLYNSISLSGVLWLLLGGILYTIGGIIYGLKPKFLEFKFLGFHEIFHIFILLGSLCHFIAVFFYLL